MYFGVVMEKVDIYTSTIISNENIESKRIWKKQKFILQKKLQVIQF